MATIKTVTTLTQDQLTSHWKSIMFIGVLFIILGIIALIIPRVFSLTFELVVGCLFFLGGAIQLYHSIHFREAPGAWLFIISALLLLVFGILMVFNPLKGIMALTLIIAVFFLLEGFVKILYAFQIKAIVNGSWVIFSGVSSIFLALFVYLGWPLSTARFIGTLLGVYLVLNGLSLFLISWKAHHQ